MISTNECLTSFQIIQQNRHTRVMSLEAAAALMCRLGCLTVLVQSKARENVPTDLLTKLKDL